MNSLDNAKQWCFGRLKNWPVMGVYGIHKLAYSSVFRHLGSKTSFLWQEAIVYEKKKIKSGLLGGRIAAEQLQEILDT